MSKQLAISIAFSVMTMAAFAVSGPPLQTGAGIIALQTNGAGAEAAAPSLFRALSRN